MPPALPDMFDHPLSYSEQCTVSISTFVQLGELPVVHMWLRWHYLYQFPEAALYLGHKFVSIQANGLW